MSISEIFKIKQYKQQIQEYINTISSLNSQLEEKNLELSTAIVKSNKLSSDLYEREKFIKERLPYFDTSRLEISSAETTRLWINAWSASIHDEPDQIDRKFRATDSRYTPLKLSRNYSSGDFRGLENDYHTTLTTCECMDFQRRAKPCKHMYRLAHELDALYLDHVQYDDDISHALHLSDFKRMMNNLSYDNQLILQALKSVDSCVVSLSDALPLINGNYLRISKDKTKLLEHYKRDELINLLPDGATIKKSSKKSELIQYIANECPDIVNNLEKLTVAVELAPPILYFRKYI